MAELNHNSSDWYVRYRAAYARRLIAHYVVDDLRSRLHMRQLGYTGCLRARRWDTVGLEEIDAELVKNHHQNNGHNRNHSHGHSDKLPSLTCRKNVSGVDPLLWNAKACSCPACWPLSYYFTVKQGMLYFSNSDPQISLDSLLKKGAKDEQGSEENKPATDGPNQMRQLKKRKPQHAAFAFKPANQAGRHYKSTSEYHFRRPTSNSLNSTDSFLGVPNSPVIKKLHEHVQGKGKSNAKHLPKLC